MANAVETAAGAVGGFLGGANPWTLGLGVGSSLLGGLIGSQQPQTQPMTPTEVGGYFTGAQGTIGQMQGFQGEMAGYGRELMDPSSGINRQQQQLMKQRSMDQLALQNLLARRQAAASGQSSGVTAAQSRMASGQASRDAMAQYSQSMLQNRQQGLGVLGQSGGMLSNILQGQMGISENLAQAALAQRQQQMQAEQQQSGMWGGILGGAGEALIGWGG